MKKVIHNIKPLLLLVMFNVLGMIIVINAGNLEAERIALLCGVVCGVSLVVYLIITFCKLGDPYLFVVVSMLCSIGIVLQTRLSANQGVEHMIMFLIGVVCFFMVFIVYRIFNTKLKSFTLIYWGLSMALFLLTAIFGVEFRGAKNWIDLGVISVQPAEIIKILYVLSIASIFTKVKISSSRLIKTNFDKIEAEKLKKKRLVTAVLITLSNAAFLVLQTEWGTMLLFFSIYMSYVYIYGESKKFLLLNLLLVLVAGSLGTVLTSHIGDRVAMWIDPWADAERKGYQIIRSISAIRAGGFKGTGIGLGYPDLIPIVESDFIFSLICEEMGVLGGIGVMMVYFLLVYRGFKIALSTTNTFNKAVATGLSVMLGIQTFIIVGGVIKLIPLTGITLPFISLGGSSMLSTFIIMGILQAISSIKGEITDEIE